MFLSTPGAPDPRVERETRALSAAGYDVEVCAWGRGVDLPPSEPFHGGRIFRLGPASGFGLGARQILRMPLFWARAFLFGLRRGFCIVHCHDLDTIPVGLALRVTGTAGRLVFDSHEVYSEFIGDRVRWLKRPAQLLERIAIGFADLLVVVTERMAPQFRRHSNICVLPNNPDLPSPLPLPLDRAELGLPSDVPVVATVSTLSVGRGILEMIEATRRVGAYYVVAGRGDLTPRIEALLPSMPHVKHLGYVPYEKAISVIRMSDVLFYGFDPDRVSDWIRHTTSNTVRLAMTAGVPMIISSLHGDSETVESIGNGVVIDRVDTETLVDALTRLLGDPAGHRGMSARGKEAAGRYQWSAVAHRLTEAYGRLIGVPAPRRRAEVRCR